MRTEEEVVALIEQHKHLVRQIVLRYTKYIEYQKDPIGWLAEGFGCLWEAARNYDPSKAKFNTHLTWKVRSVVGHHRDKQKRHYKKLKKLADSGQVRTEYTVPDTLMETEDKRVAAEQVQKLLAATPLTEKERLVFDLLLMAELPASEVAARLGCSSTRIHTLRQKVVGKLRRTAQQMEKQ
jgi:RNA polymerase sigma factor (sigma-70 family)